MKPAKDTFHSSSSSSSSSFLIQSKCFYVLQLTVGFEYKLNNNAVREKKKHLNFIKEMSRNYRCVKFVNLSMSSLGIFLDECSTFLDIMNDIGIDKKQQLYIIKKMINIAIRATYYIFCCRNRNWDSPDLMQFWFSFLLLLFFWNNSISSSICKLPIRSEIYDCTFKNSNKVSINYLSLIIIILWGPGNPSFPFSPSFPFPLNSVLLLTGKSWTQSGVVTFILLPSKATISLASMFIFLIP